MNMTLFWLVAALFGLMFTFILDGLRALWRFYFPRETRFYLYVPPGQWDEVGFEELMRAVRDPERFEEELEAERFGDSDPGLYPERGGRDG